LSGIFRADYYDEALGQISLLLQLHIRPIRGFSKILDEGRIVFAAITAVAVLIALQVPRSAEYQQQETRATMQRIKARVDKVAAQAARNRSMTPEQIQHYLEAEDLADVMGAMGPPPVGTAMERFVGQNPGQYFAPLIAMAVCFVPMVILVLTVWDNLGGFATILFRDYMALFVCCLSAWTASYGVLAIVTGTLRVLHLPAYNYTALWWAAHLYFLFLTALAVRTLFGAKFTHTIGAVGGAWASAVGGIWLHATFGNVSSYLASPFVLYYLYRGFSPQLAGIGVGLQSRQRLKQGLENATLNPRDADAHYQLGLIYAQRRQFESAIEHFRKAIDIDPNEPDAYYQLGRIAREQGRHAEAIQHFRAAARIDDKYSSSEVWREIGIASLLAGDCEGARQTLEKYLQRRPYDPEGACWYGRTMARLGQGELARAAFNQAMESVRTMPAARKRHVRCWESEARKELKKLPASPLAVSH
jgi:Flp pilus assembly protein TadD